ncbi:MAG TPA: DNA-directed RNA polymerase subunit omega, partial [Candidatus Krumholzibacterium sp.]|nr:DNA-directed RNA polymerase subunit omega [Candidatus Krumholzibacterium sp.]
MKTKAMEEILQRIDNRYEAIRVLAREARRINNIIRMAPEEIEEKPTTIAVNRLTEGKVKYYYEEP